MFAIFAIILSVVMFSLPVIVKAHRIPNVSFEETLATLYRNAEPGLTLNKIITAYPFATPRKLYKQISNIDHGQDYDSRSTMEKQFKPCYRVDCDGNVEYVKDFWFIGDKSYSDLMDEWEEMESYTHNPEKYSSGLSDSPADNYEPFAHSDEPGYNPDELPF